MNHRILEDRVKKLEKILDAIREDQLNPRCSMKHLKWCIETEEYLERLTKEIKATLAENP